MAAKAKATTRKKVATKCQPERYKLLKASGQTIGGHNSTDVYVFGERMSKPEKRHLFKVLAAQLDYAVN